MINPGRTYSFFFKEYRKRSLLVIGLLILAGIAEAVGVMAFLPFLQIVLEGDVQEGLAIGPLNGFFAALNLEPDFLTIAAFIGVAMTMKALILWLCMRYVSQTVAKIAGDLRLRLMQALLKANWKFFAGHAMGKSLNAVVMEGYRSSMAFISAARCVASGIQFLIYATGAFLVSWKVFSGGIIVGVLLASALWVLVHIARKAGQRQTEMEKGLLSHMADMLQGIKPLRAMALESKFLETLGGDSSGLQRAQYEQLITGQSMRIFHEPLMVITALAGIYIAVVYGGLEASDLALVCVLFFRMLTGMSGMQSEYQRLAVQESALWSLLDSIEETEAAADNWPGTGEAPAQIESVEFKGVSFSHAEHSVLSKADLSFEPNKMTALVGPSGSGKTTALDLLSGFYQPKTGQVLINGTSLDEIDLEKWRKVLGFVPQEVFLFNDNVIENVLVGRGNISEEQVWQALEAAGAKEFVEKMPGGLEAPVGENGRKLSGGQRQRIAIARAIVHKPQLLLLDEATSALDPETEQNLLDTLKKLSKEMTVICISHNLTVLDYADTVYEVRAGKIDKKKMAA